ncbi:hypothetical protein EDD11_009329 [Mortierella claussenii]|nr:hypothetical protein EDD11_009329 [Mortierella claussenii]
MDARHYRHQGGSREGYDFRDDYHRSPMNGSYHAARSYGGNSMEYRINNGSSNSLEGPYHREGSYSSEYLNDSTSTAFNNSHNRSSSTSHGEQYAHVSSSGVHSNSNSTNKLRHNSISSNASQSSSSSMTFITHRPGPTSSSMSMAGPEGVGSLSANGPGSGNKHPCNFPTCGWSFKRFEHLKRHMLVHTKERPFVCDFHGCEKSFSRSDNFSAHLRTHTKKALHMRRFDRHPMLAGGMDPIRTQFSGNPGGGGVSSAGAIGGGVGGQGHGMSAGGPLSGVPPHRPQNHYPHPYQQQHEEQQQHARYRHSIAGYPSFHSGAGSSEELQGTNSYSHDDGHDCLGQGAGRPTRNSYCCPSSDDHHHLDPAAASEYESKSRMGAGTGPSSLSLKHPRHSLSSSNMHPLDSPTSDGLCNIVPKFNTIKLDLKAVTNNPEDVHLHSHYEQRSMHQAYDETREHNGHLYRNSTHAPQYPHQRYSSPERDASCIASKVKTFSAPASPSLQPQHRHASLKGHENSNLNPNGESPARAPRSVVPSSSLSGAKASYEALCS